MPLPRMVAESQNSSHIPPLPTAFGATRRHEPRGDHADDEGAVIPRSRQPRRLRIRPMGNDLHELKLVFLDEYRENIELLETGLMRVSDGVSDTDTMNEVFRAVHSIKGGAATVGFMPMSELTHYMEMLLHEMRAGRRAVNEADIDLLDAADATIALADIGPTLGRALRQL